MTKHRGLVFALAMIALAGIPANEARAGSLTMILEWGASTLTITGGPFATLTATASGESLTLNVGPLNAFLASHGSALAFAAGSGVSDNQSVATNATGAILTSNGNLSVVQTSAGLTTMTIDAYKTDWNTPSGATGMLMNSGSATFGLTPKGNTETFNSWYNNDNSADGKLLGAGLQTYTSTGDPVNSPPGSPPNFTGAAISPFVTPFSLTNETIVSLTKSGKTGENGQYQVQTTVSANAVPEPASMVIMLTSMPLPLVILVLLQRRRRAAA